MNLYVWKYVENVTDSYHNGGGILAVAPTLAAAHEQIRARKDIPAECGALSMPPDLSAETALGPQVIVFPDAGCC